MKVYPLILFVLVCLQGCTDGENSAQTEPLHTQEEAANPYVYKRERKFTFLAFHFDQEGVPVALDTVFLSTSSAVFNEKYGQTLSSWTSTGNDFGSNSTGITEHDTAVWIHPPRDGKYKKLELSPFPMVQIPVNLGNEWTWKLLVGGHYSIPGYAEWPDNKAELFTSTYKITRKVPVTTKAGEIDCHEIDSYTDSSFGQTKLKAYYSPLYGFVKLEYQNIDKGRLTMELVDVQNIQPKAKLPFKDLALELR